MVSRIELSARLFLIYLQDASVISDTAAAEWKHNGKNSVTVLISANEGSSKEVFGRNITEIELVLVGMSDGRKVMLSLCSDDESLEQGVFDYEKDLQLPLESSGESKELQRLYAEGASFLFEQRFGLLKRSRTEALPVKASDPSLNIDVSSKEGLPTDVDVAHYPKRRPPDMPEFEDEYDIQAKPTIPAMGHLGEGLRGMPHGRGSYGDVDLYPTGQKYPNLLDPRPTSGPSGGMIFDPRRSEELPLPYGGSFDPNNKDDSKRPPGFMPGARWNKPFGGGGFNSPGGGPFGFQ